MRREARQPRVKIELRNLPNIECRGLVHRVVERTTRPSGGQGYLLGCGQFINVAARSHYDTDADVTCLACIADVKDKDNGL